MCQGEEDMLFTMKFKSDSADLDSDLPYGLALTNNVCGLSYPRAERHERPSGLLSREELLVLTGTMQPKRMCQWLEMRGWAFEPPARRGDTPKVLRAYHDARLSGVRLDRPKRADYSFMTLAGHR